MNSTNNQTHYYSLLFSFIGRIIEWCTLVIYQRWAMSPTLASVRFGVHWLVIWIYAIKLECSIMPGILYRQKYSTYPYSMRLITALVLRHWSLCLTAWHLSTIYSIKYTWSLDLRDRPLQLPRKTVQKNLFQHSSALVCTLYCISNLYKKK